MALKNIADGVWIDTGPTSIVGMKLTATMCVLRLGQGELLVYSPIALTDARRAEVEALGPVAHLYAPNLFHHLWMADWVAAFPNARLHGPAGLPKKRRDLRLARSLPGEPEPAFEGVIDELFIDGFRLEESVLFYRPAGTLVVADLVHNVGKPTQGWAKFYARTMGFYDKVALSGVLRWTAFSDKKAARQSIERLLKLPIERIVVGHGTPILSNARRELSQAYAFLPLA